AGTVARASTTAAAGDAEAEPGFRPGPSPTSPWVPSCTPSATTPSEATAAADAATRRNVDGEVRRGPDIPPLRVRGRDESDHGTTGPFRAGADGLVTGHRTGPAGAP